MFTIKGLTQVSFSNDKRYSKEKNKFRWRPPWSLNNQSGLLEGLWKKEVQIFSKLKKKSSQKSKQRSSPPDGSLLLANLS